MLEFFPAYLKTKKLCKHAVKKLPCIIRYGLDWYKVQQMCDKANVENSRRLESVPDC